MSSRYLKLIIVAIPSLILAITFPALPGNAQWIENGNLVSSVEGTQTPEVMLPDLQAGAFIVWDDPRFGNTDVFMQRIDMWGRLVFPDSDIGICLYDYTQTDPSAVPDGKGGLIIAWHDSRDWDSGQRINVYSQRVDREGNILWNPDGVPVATQDWYQQDVSVISDENGGAIMAWRDSRAGFDYRDIYIQRIDSSGAAVWAEDGIEICTYISQRSVHAICSNGSGGAIVAWSDDRPLWDDMDLYAQMVGPGGDLKWNTQGVAVCTSSTVPLYTSIIPDGTGRFVILWIDERTGYETIYAQRIDFDGNTMWAENGIQICSAGSDQRYFVAELASPGRIFLTWSDYRNGSSWVQYAQSIDSTGALLWQADGVFVIDLERSYSSSPNMSICPDGEGNVHMTWGLFTDILYQKIDTDGSLVFPGYLPVCQTDLWQVSPNLCTDGDGGVLIGYGDKRYDVTYDLYCQRMDRNGYWGYPCPIVSAEDTPGDEGGSITVSWTGSRMDTAPDNLITEYYLWEMIPQSDEWVCIDTTTADQSTDYSHTRLSCADSCAASSNFHSFYVTALTTDQDIFWTSLPDSGYSFHDLAPACPSGLAGCQSEDPAGLMLTWLSNSEHDFLEYRLFRDVTEGFTPSDSNLVYSGIDTFFLDTEWVSWAASYYQLQAVDSFSNGGDMATLSPEEMETATLLLDFSANATPSGIVLDWQLSDPGESPGFSIERVDLHDDSRVSLTDPLISESNDKFSFEDHSAVPGREYVYYVSMIGESGSMFLFESGPVTMPALSLTLYQNTPNPFNPSTTIRFYLPERISVRLEVFDVKGRLVTTILDRVMEAGNNECVWNGLTSNGITVSSGLYFYRLIAGKKSMTRKTVLLR